MNLEEVHLFSGFSKVSSNGFSGVVNPVGLKKSHFVLSELEIESVQKWHDEGTSSFESPVGGEHPVEEWNDSRGEDPVEIDDSSQDIESNKSS